MYEILCSGGDTSSHQFSHVEFLPAPKKMSTRYKPKPITATDAVIYNGTTLRRFRRFARKSNEWEAERCCSSLPSGEKLEVYVGDVILKSLGNGNFSTLGCRYFPRPLRTAIII